MVLSPSVPSQGFCHFLNACNAIQVPPQPRRRVVNHLLAHWLLPIGGLNLARVSLCNHLLLYFPFGWGWHHYYHTEWPGKCTPYIQSAWVHKHYCVGRIRTNCLLDFLLCDPEYLHGTTRLSAVGPPPVTVSLCPCPPGYTKIPGERAE